MSVFDVFYVLFLGFVLLVSVPESPLLSPSLLVFFAFVLLSSVIEIEVDFAPPKL